ncbi:MAG: NADH-quinone oxidoreductase subunit M [Planctomycetales bacterium]|nr:NADH-quinone oxidoreductase subunit M [Planctomycetales bacterium]
MLDSSKLLLISLTLPLIGAALAVLAGARGATTARQSALITSLLTLLTVGTLVFRFPGGVEPFATANLSWLGADSGFDIRLRVGLDGLSVWLFGLSALLTVTCVLVSWDSIRQGAAGFYALLLLLEAGMLGVFAARDIILFYVCFEFTLIPLFFLIGIWGSEDRRRAAVKFFLFTLAGSVLTFLGLLTIVLQASQHAANGQLVFGIPELTQLLMADASHAIDTRLQVFIFLALFAGFAIKVPLFPLHTWLPLAHVQAPTAGSVVLAGVLLKIGTYGFLRFSIPMLPDATVRCMPFLLWLSVIGILYGALVALAQKDVKRLIAYSSVSHLGFCMLGLFALNRLGVQGGALQMINHGLSTGGLFACVGMIYQRYHTRQIGELGGMARTTPVLAFFMLVFTFSSIGLPGLNGFAGEFLLLIGMFQRARGVNPAGLDWQYMTIAVLAVSGVILGAWYMLLLIQKIFFGPTREPSSDEHTTILDLRIHEVAALTPLVVFIVWIGIRPGTFLAPMAPTLDQTTAQAEQVYRQGIIEAHGLRPIAVEVTRSQPDFSLSLPSLAHQLSPHSDANKDAPRR